MKDLSNENIIHIKKEGIEYIKFKRLLEYKNIIHAFTLKPLDFGQYNHYEKNKVQINSDYDKISNELEIKFESICRPIQTHTDVVKAVEDGDEGIYIEKFRDVDALMTNQNNKALVLAFADCTPLLFFDPVENVIANTHSGWKGTLQTIGAKTVEKMKKEFRCKPENIICCIGPHIRKCHFEVEQDVKDLFYKKFKDMENINQYIVKEQSLEGTKIDNKYYIDTTSMNKQTLLDKGLKKENIIDSNICTVCNSDVCHSFRAEKELSGRSIAIICKE